MAENDFEQRKSALNNALRPFPSFGKSKDQIIAASVLEILDYGEFINTQGEDKRMCEHFTNISNKLTELLEQHKQELDTLSRSAERFADLFCYNKKKYVRTKMRDVALLGQTSKGREKELLHAFRDWSQDYRGGGRRIRRSRRRSGDRRISKRSQKRGGRRISKRSRRRGSNRRRGRSRKRR
jgi:hypothetical protein